MLRVKIRFDKLEEKKAIKIEGYAEEYPEIGNNFSVFILKNGKRIIIDLGRISNIKSYGDLLLVQTDLIVAEVWVLDDQGGEVIPLKENTLFRVGGRITGFRRKGSSRGVSAVTQLLELLKEERDANDAKPRFRLLKGELKC